MDIPDKCNCVGVVLPGYTKYSCVSDLMCEPGIRDLRSSSVSQHVVLHALHTGVLSHFRAICRLVILHLCKQKHKQMQIMI